MWTWNSQSWLNSDFGMVFLLSCGRGESPSSCTHLPRADPSVDYLQTIAIETKNGAMVSIYYWRCKNMGDQRRTGSRCLWCKNQMNDGSCQTWGESLATHRQAPLHHFSQESTAVSYGTCTQQNFNAKQAKKKKTKQCFLPIKWIDFLLLSVREAIINSSIYSLSNGPLQVCPVLQVSWVCT